MAKASKPQTVTEYALLSKDGYARYTQSFPHTAERIAYLVSYDPYTTDQVISRTYVMPAWS